MNRSENTQPPRRSRPRLVGPVTTAALPLVAGAVLVAVALAGPVSTRAESSGAAVAERPAAKSALKRFSSCAQLNDYASRHAEALPIVADGIAVEDGAGVAGTPAPPRPSPEARRPRARRPMFRSRASTSPTW